MLAVVWLARRVVLVASHAGSAPGSAPSSAVALR
jgi:hypothetical protein